MLYKENETKNPTEKRRERGCENMCDRIAGQWTI